MVVPGLPLVATSVAPRKSFSVAPVVTLPTSNVRLAALVLLSVLSDPVSLAACRSGVPGALGAAWISTAPMSTVPTGLVSFLLSTVAVVSPLLPLLITAGFAGLSTAGWLGGAGSSA